MSLFSEYATSSAFRIDLTQKMAQALHVIDIYDRGSPVVSKTGNEVNDWTDMKEAFGHLSDPFIASSRSLLRRGLVEWHDLPKKPDGKADWSKKTWRMTEAGRHVLALCRLAGIVPQVSNVVPMPKKKTPVRRRA